LKEVEGRGDDVTDVVTGLAGMTKGTYNSIVGMLPKGSLPKWEEKEPSDKDLLKASNAYVNSVYQDYSSNFPGFSELPAEAQDMILSSAYNLGKDFHKKAPKFRRAVSEGSSMEAARQLLDTAQADGMSMMGLARRRALEYNALARASGEPLISQIVQDDDGTVSYRYVSGEGAPGTLMSFKRPRHPKSPAGSFSLSPSGKVFRRSAQVASKGYGAGGTIRSRDGRRFI